MWLFPAGQKFYILQHAQWLWGSIQRPMQSLMSNFPLVNITTYLHIVPRFRVCKNISPHTHTPSGHDTRSSTRTIYVLRYDYCRILNLYCSPQGTVSDPVKPFTLFAFCILTCKSCNYICNFTLSILAQVAAISLGFDTVVNCLHKRTAFKTQTL